MFVDEEDVAGGKGQALGGKKSFREQYVSVKDKIQPISNTKSFRKRRQVSHTILVEKIRDRMGMRLYKEPTWPMSNPQSLLRHATF